MTSDTTTVVKADETNIILKIHEQMAGDKYDGVSTTRTRIFTPTEMKCIDPPLADKDGYTSPYDWRNKGQTKTETAVYDFTAEKFAALLAEIRKGNFDYFAFEYFD